MTIAGPEGTARVAKLIEAIANEVTLIDANGSILHSTAGSKGSLGYEPSFWKKRNVLDLAHPDDVDLARHAMVELLGDPGGVRTERFRARHASGRWMVVEVSATNLLDDPDVGAIVVTTRSLIGEERLRRANARAQRHLALQADYVAAVSHELRTPLQAILGGLDLLADEVDGPTADLVAVLQADGARLGTVIDDILTYHRITTDTTELMPRPTNLADLLSTVSAVVDARLGDERAISVQVDSDIGDWVAVDPLRLRQAVSLLVVGLAERATGPISVTASAAGSATVAFTVAATEAMESSEPRPVNAPAAGPGVGIAPGHMNLATASRLIEAMGGELIHGDETDEIEGDEIEGEEDQTGHADRTEPPLTLSFVIPAPTTTPSAGDPSTASARHDSIEAGVATPDRSDHKVPAAPVESDHVPTVGTSTGADEPEQARRREDDKSGPAKLGRAIIVDDSEINRTVIGRQLQSLGLSVETAENGRAGVDKITASRYDLVIMDWHMPELDGLAATREIRAYESDKDYHTLIVAMTASAMPGDRERCLNAGMDDFLAKPATKEQVATVVLAHLAPETPSETEPAPAGGGPAPEVTQPGQVRSGANESAIDGSTLDTMVGDLGDRDTVHMIVEAYLGDLPVRCGTITAAIADGNETMARREAHTLKSPSQMVGALALGALCQAIEDGNAPLSNSTGDELERLADDTRAGLEEWLAASTAPV